MQFCTPLFILYVLTIGGKQGGFEIAYTGGDKDLLRVIMHIEAGALHAVAASLPEDDPYACFDRVVQMEPGVTVDAEEGLVGLWDGVDGGNEDL